jgi:hypothetical protein
MQLNGQTMENPGFYYWFKKKNIWSKLNKNEFYLQEGVLKEEVKDEIAYEGILNLLIIIHYIIFTILLFINFTLKSYL